MAAIGNHNSSTASITAKEVVNRFDKPLTVEKNPVAVKPEQNKKGKKKNPGQTWVHEEPVMGIEPATGGLQNRCSTTELHRQILRLTTINRCTQDIKNKPRCQYFLPDFSAIPKI
jgi:hypothetical protein